MLRFFLSIFLFAFSEKLHSFQQSCDGQTPEMHSFLYLRPTNFIIGSGNTTVNSRKECEDICLKNINCAFAYYLMYNCYQVNYFQTTLTRFVPGETLIKLFRNESSCGIPFPTLMSNAVKFPLKSRAGASFSFALSNNTVTFNYDAVKDRFGKRKK